MVFHSLKEKWAIQTDFSFNQKGANPKDDYIRHSYHSNKPLDTVKVKLNFEYIDFGLYIKYFINSKLRSVRPYINIGFILGYHLNKKNPIIISINGGEFKNMYDNDYFPKAEIGIAGKFGILYMVNEHVGVFGEFRTSFTELYFQERLAKFTNTLYNFTIGVYL